MYQKILAEIHDRYFPDISDGAFEHVCLLSPFLKGCRCLDLGCGSGRLLKNLFDVGCEVSGVDSSPEMVDRALSRLPGADIRTGNILTYKLERYDIVTMVGEILSYALQGAPNRSEASRIFFQKVFNSLDCGGMFLFDFLIEGFDFSGRYFRDEEEFTVYAEVLQSRFDIQRHLTSFLKKESFYEKSVEIHELVLLKPGMIEEQLADCGFTIKKVDMYGTTTLLDGRVGFECTRP
jgi:SAM-dependent methyltransferase